MNLNEKTKHFLFRAGFGPSMSDNQRHQSIDEFFSQSKGLKPIGIVDNTMMDGGRIEGQARKDLFQKAKQQVLRLNGVWISQMSDPEVRFREKMTLFWHDHFACRIRAPYLAQQQNNVLRRDALGGFGDLLTAISKDPGMLQFLNNQQNKKNSPNENFAREVLELFTLGRGNYSEEDIKNGARAFTGWSFDPSTGKFLFKEKIHDDGVKSFKGKRGHFSGEDILKIILDDQQTAFFITEKLWSYFVHTESFDREIISSLAKEFFHSGYDISKLMKSIFLSDWFYEPKYRSNRIKSPIELIAGIMTQTGGSFENPQASLFIQRALSQILFYPPNVGGWPTGISWIDSSSLTFRLSLPNILLKNATPMVDAKDDGDVNNVTNMANTKKLSLLVDWPSLTNQFVKTNEDETIDLLAYHLLAGGLQESNRKIVRKYAGTSTGDPEFIKKAFVAIMSLPEYQLS